MPAALRAAWIQRVQNDAGAEYSIARTRERGIEARHPRQDLRTQFSADSVELTARDGSAPLRMRLARVNGRKPGRGSISHEANRVTVTRPGIDEWYVHGPMGLEQGFTIPASLTPDDASDTRLRLEMAVEGKYTPTMRGDVIVWNGPERRLETRELYAFDADGKQLSASMWASATKLVIDVDTSGARYPIEVDPIWLEQQKLIASTASALGWFGYSVSVSGDTAIIGMPRDGVNGIDSGSAYVFFRNGTNWTTEQKLLASDNAAGDQFGFSVSLDGDRAVIGAYQDDDNGTDSGSAYVFSRSGSVWSQDQKLIASDGSPDDQFGYSTSISGDTVVIGARYDADNGLLSGSAYVFVGSGSVWSEQQKLLALDGGSGDHFGSSVSISLDTIVVGAFQDDDNGTDSGSAYVFVRSGVVWSEEQKLLASDGAAVDRFGFSVSVDADTAVLGAPLDDDNGSGSGSAYVFVRSGVVWTEQQKLIASDGAVDDQFGHSVSISGDSAAVGARLDDDGNNATGSAYVFVRSGAVWTEQQKLLASGVASQAFGTSVSISGDVLVGGAPLGVRPGIGYLYERVGTAWTAEQKLGADAVGPSDEFFGTSVSVSGDTAAVGAPSYDDGTNTDSGAAYVFVRSGAAWTEQQELRSSDLAAGDNFGSSVSVSGDTLIVGAKLEDDIAGNAGAAYVFVRSGGVWTEQQKLTASDGGPSDWFGDSVSLSGDTAVVGALLHDGAGTSSGAAYVYFRSGVKWAEQQKLLASDGAADDQFGTSVSVSGDTAVIGAVLDDDAGSGSGSAYVFTRSGGVWTEEQKLVPLDSAADDRFGSAVSVSGNTAVIGARWDDDNGGNAGSAYVFTRSGGVWTEQQELFSSDGPANAWFGSAVSVDGDALLIGNWHASDNGNDSGAAYLFVRSGGVWTEQDKIVASDGEPGDQFGWSVSLSGDTALLGAKGDDDRGPGAGAAYAFVLMLENGDLCSFDSECLSAFCDPVNLVCACDETADCLISEVCDTSEDPNACEPVHSCGNGVVEAGETCDDGGAVSGDGCSAGCFVDSLPNGSDCSNGGNAACASGVCDTSETPDTCEAANACGNGVIEAGETCDDGNVASGDGCSASCFVDNLPNGGDCSLVGAASCTSGVCDATETPDSCEPANTCGNGSVEPGEACDDGGTIAGDGCSPACFVETQPDGSDCTLGGDAACASGVCDRSETPDTCEPSDACGNSVLEAGEACDDGNRTSGDGCSAFCFVDSLPTGVDCSTNGGASCASGVCDTTETPALCEPANVCGNGLLEFPEVCDDGNTLSGDGCSMSCFVEAQTDGSDCGVGGNAACMSGVCDVTETPSTCEPANTCGNGLLEGAEVCDDGNSSADDGCDPQCLLEIGAGPCTDAAQCGNGVCNTLATTPVCALPLVCGNGHRDVGEACDDGNRSNDDGCTEACALKNVWRGGGGCAVSQDADSGGPLPWLLGLLMLLGRRRRFRQPRPLARGVVFMATVGVCLSAGVAHAQVDCSATGTTGVPQIECEALMALYASADGANWTDNSNWDTASAVDTWFGVAVSAGQVTGLSLFTNQLTGAIPSELGNLAGLTDLRLYDNQLTGTIPPALGGLANLRTLYLHMNQLTGPVPPELGALSNVSDLRMNSNQLTGPIPPELGNLANLTTLYLYSNQLSGPIPPELENLASLRGLYLYGNQLTGTIPPGLGNLSNLTTLHLSANLFTGPIPPELGNLANLVALHAYGNQLSGTIPPELGSLANLTSLHLGNNELTGPIPPELGDLANLVSFFAYGNQLSGSLPPELGNLANLSTLYLVSNQLSGPIPPELGNLSSLTTMFLSNNQLSGPIPPELGNLVNLDTLYLHANQLTGTIPPELGNLANLDTLYLYGNVLTGTIPPELGNLANLTALQLSSNQLTGTIPPELGSLANLTAMYLHSNQLSGSIPPELGDLANLTTLHLSSNQLSGDIPDLTALPLTSLAFSGNGFVFADFEAEFADYSDGTPATFSYSSQAMVDTARVENFPVGAPALLPSAVAPNPSGNDEYQWYKDSTPIPGPEGTARDLDVTLGAGAVSPAHTGDYHYTITNTVVTGVTLTSQRITLTVSATCGDGFVNDPSEVCDDGNLNTGDGCNAACLLEVGELCADHADCASNLCNLAAMPPVCAPPVGCGNGLLELGEGCDDGNNMNGDGCTAACAIEDGNRCTSDAECASGVCDVNEAPPICEPAGSCGNGVLDARESCDDGNLMTRDGCSNVCLLEDGEPCTDDAQCESAVCDTVGSDTCESANSCGNGAVEAGEVCDDGNAAAGDGCSAECLFELGAGPCADNAQCESRICDVVDSNTCEPANACGNGAIESGEVCDDGNDSAGDGCDPQCLLEIGAGPCTDDGQCGNGVCNTLATTPVCALPLVCGNGHRDVGEACDDGNRSGDDGCSESCALKNVWRGGGGCAVGRNSDSGGQGWLLGLALAGLLCRRRRLA